MSLEGGFLYLYPHPPSTVRQVVGEVQSLELHQYKIAMVLSTILIKNKVFLHYKMVFDEILDLIFLY